MLSGKELILATKPFAKEIRWKSWYQTLSAFVLLIGGILGTVFVPTIWGKLACSVFTAMMLSRVFIIFHDYQHHAILQKSLPANILFTIFAESDCKMCSVAGGCYDGIVGRPDQCQTKSSTKIMTFYEGGNVVCSGGGDGNPVEASFSGTLGTPVSFDTYAWFQCFGGEG